MKKLSVKSKGPRLSPDLYLRFAATAEQCAMATANLVKMFEEVLGIRIDTGKKINLRALSGGRWTSFSQFPHDARETARCRMKVMLVYYGAIERGLSVTNAIALAQRMWRMEFRNFARQRGRELSRSMRDCSYDKIERLRKKVEEFGGPLAPIEAYLDGKACRHRRHASRVPRKSALKDAA
jgi:hypothetical protein